jgi:hypothetical protein
MNKKTNDSQLTLGFSESALNTSLPRTAAPQKCKVVDLYAKKIEHTRKFATEQLQKLGLIHKPC